MKPVEKTPLSDRARFNSVDNKDNNIVFLNYLLSLLFILLAIVSFGASGVIVGIISSTLLVAVWVRTSYFFFNKYRIKREKILRDNEVDFAKACQLRETLEKFSALRASSLPVVEGAVPGEWKPFRVEHALSNSLRAEVYRENIRGIATPNLFDSSYVVFLKNADAVLRVIVPSPRATQEMLKQTIALCSKDIWRDSHVGNLLYNFSVKDDVLLYNISHPQLIDSLDASCEMPIEVRPTVKVLGEKIQDGVVIATALEVNGRQETFLPSGFFQKLVAEIAPILGMVKEPPRQHVAAMN